VLSFKSIRQIEAIERLMQVVEHRSDVGARFNGGKSEYAQLSGLLPPGGGKFDLRLLQAALFSVIELQPATISNMSTLIYIYTESQLHPEERETEPFCAPPHSLHPEHLEIVFQLKLLNARARRSFASRTI
jgi:hypothetical protein